jgi:type I restriction enzyme S subunit
VRFAPLKRLVQSARPITYGIVQAGPEVADGVPYIRPVDMTEHDGCRSLQDLPRTSAEIAAQYRRSSVISGDIVVSIGPSYGKTMIVPDELAGANLTQGTARVSVSSANDARYVRWCLRSAPSVAHWDAAVGGATFRALNLGPLAETPIPLLPLPRQTAIADYLDTETARIDALIAKKQRMIDLLTERLWAVLDELGAEIERSRTTAMKRLAVFFTDGDWIESPYITDSGIRLIQTGNIGRGEFIDQGDRYISEDTFVSLGCTEVLPGDVLISRLANTVGQACVAPDLGCRLVASVDVVILRPAEFVSADYLVRYLSADRHLSLARLAARGTTMQRLARSQLGDFPVRVPSLDEQRRMVERVDTERPILQAVLTALSTQIDLLRERRQTLISAAVTGELEIPGVAA